MMLSRRLRRVTEMPPAVPWTPAEITTALWLDADDTATITEVSGAVSQWDDKSGNARHVSQATAGSRPTISGATLTFNGSKYLFNTAPFMYAAGSAAIFIVANITPVFNTFSVAEGNSGTADPVYSLPACRSNTDANDMAVLIRRTGTAIFVNSPTLILDNGMATGAAVIGITDTGSTLTGYRNGVAGSAISYTRGTAPSFNRFAIGGLLRNTFAAGITMSLNEAVIITGGITTETRQLIEGYLAWKWGLQANLPSGHPYEDAAPTV